MVKRARKISSEELFTTKLNELQEEIAFNSKYSPMFSPIEELFSYLKQHIKVGNIMKTLKID